MDLSGHFICKADVLEATSGIGGARATLSIESRVLKKVVGRISGHLDPGLEQDHDPHHTIR